MTAQVVELESVGRRRYAIRLRDGSFVTSAVSSFLPVTFNSLRAAFAALKAMGPIGGTESSG